MSGSGSVSGSGGQGAGPRAGIVEIAREGIGASVIKVRGLVKRYGEYEAVAGIDLDVHRGEIFALLGPNGAGKTTTLEMLEGYRRREAGSVSVLGVDPELATLDWRSRIGLVLQTSKMPRS